jgi:excisionase family DNA binding protein
MEQKEEVLTLKELRQKLKCSESMVRKMIREGLPKFKIGNEYRFYLTKVINYLETK